ncbi:S41 family peptidase [Anaerosphaera multitolerans]|uniref:Peptidase S41 n=1 Tax=Anaerosphaera multitolerans TaxID=2487351 RepID=A0A437S508_9FIRM|nr:S41 family peptidase [Anaerosphaera multitolerans]RVU54122.1 peptidase S41 [Anaerosphaera multitolerans]
MNKKRNLILLLLVILVSFMLFKRSPAYNIPKLDPLDLSEEKQLTSEEYIEDFNYMFEVLKKHYPYFEVNRELNALDFTKYYDLYKSKIEKCENDNDFINALNSILSELNNGHTNVLKRNFVFTAYINYYNLPENDWRHKMSEVFEKEKVRRRYNITTEELKDFNKQNYSSSTEMESNLIAEDIINGQVGYLYIKQMISADEENKNFKLDKDIINNYLENIKDYKALIIDIRGNKGGDSAYWSKFLLPKLLKNPVSTKNYIFLKDGPLFKSLTSSMKNVEDLTTFNFPENTLKYLDGFKYYYESVFTLEPLKESINFSGNLYLLVDRRVYSSSEKLASFCKETGIAILVGEKTGGDGIGDDPFIFDLPNSGLLIRFPKEMGITESGSINELDKTIPQYIVEPINRVFLQDGKLNYENDKCIKKVLELENINM